MKTKTFLSLFVAITIALFAVNIAAALPVTFGEVTVNDVDLSYGSTTTISGTPGEVVPVIVRFDATADVKDIKVKVAIGDSSSVSTSRFDVLNGVSYVKRLSITLPNTYDMDDSNETWTLKVTISSKSGDEQTSPYTITMQRDAFSFNFLSVDAPMRASAGDIIALDIVLKNTGSRTADDAFVTVSIPELGVSKVAYFGDLVAQDKDNGDSNDNEDARERRVYLVIPSDAKSDDYELQVRASNYDTSSMVKKVISINGIASNNSTAIAPTAGNNQSLPTSIVVLTVVLVIIFVVLLIVLVVLLTKKPTEKSEDFGESYY